MAHLGLSLSGGASVCRSDNRMPAGDALAQALRNLPPQAPVVVMVHGYMYAPTPAAADPHRLIYAPTRRSRDPRYQSWPEGLGFTAHRDEGLCIGFAWPACPEETRFGGLGRGFAGVYRRAAAAGAALAETLEIIGALRPGRPVGLICHSLGARVTLQALVRLNRAQTGSVVIMGGAEYLGAAETSLAAPHAAGFRIYNVTSRENRVCDYLFGRFGPAELRGGPVLSAGLGHRIERWVDLPIDRPAMRALAASRGIALCPRPRPLSHWSFYTRPGALAVYGDIFRHPEAWRPQDVKARLAVPATGRDLRPVAGMPLPA